jgi:hypothetical protein
MPKNLRLDYPERIFPDRKILRERSKQARREKRRQEAMLDKRNLHGDKDLTPYNAVGRIRNSNFEIQYR